MGKQNVDRPAYLSSDDARYSVGIHRGPMAPKGLDESSKLELVESAGGRSLATTRTRRQKFAAHWRRFWFCYLLGNVIFLAIFLPVFFLVAIPAISQLVVNKSDLVLVNASVMQPRPDSIVLTLQSALDLHLALSVRIEPLSLNLFERDTGPEYPWGKGNIPGITIRGNTTLGVKTQHTPLLNQTVWTDYVHDVVFKKESTLAVRGSTNSYLGVLKSHVTMDKDITSPTLNSFEGFSLSDTYLKLPPLEDGTNLLGNATLPNPSVLTLEIGQIVLEVKSGDLVIGNATLEDVILRPGNNTFPVKGILDIPTILQNIGQVLADQGPSIKQGSLSLVSTTRTVKWNGTVVPYYTDVMSQLPLTAKVGLVSTVKKTVQELFSGGKNITDVIHELTSYSKGNGTALLDDLKQGIQAIEGKNSSSGALHEMVKRNLYLRDEFQESHPDQTDELFNSLTSWIAKH
ncbi:hypothetical protein N7468_009454 [Penicillium chermesinum]|uniref:Uncharacterized protein n=1 Tax=Penicillium chermesinum TaxID=63820 RepID=A0A9W9TG58_9EURO|nr:uncharacterized protein N7468_009454 [Penicillium chermesinum]KAJ5220250.1 hypothetical protein N7468_009454 [Penicillium chermesinum]KAJ6157694.1 hypothetical protein N7470_005286 [Penicillium chermesinum]